MATTACTAALALSVSACSSGGEAENADASPGASQNKTSNAADQTTATSREEEAVPTELSPRGEEVSTTSTDGSVTVTGYATSLSHGDPKIVVTWKSNSDRSNCDLTLTREDPRGYLLNVYESAECSGTQEFELVSGLDEDASDVPGVHNIAVLGFDELITLGVDVPA